ncbi:MAG: MFS transporter [Actinomycetota bacterium]
MTTPAETDGSRALVIGAVTAIVLVALETLGIAAAMPVISDELDGEALYGAVFSAFYLAQVVAIAVAGHLTGRRPLHLVFATGLAVFGVGLLAATVAPTMEILVATRVVQGLGAGLIASAVYATITLGFSDERRPMVLAYVSSAWVAPAFIAPPLAGFLAEEVSWRWVFGGVTPLVPVVAALAIPPLRRIESADGSDLALRDPLVGGLVTAIGIGLGQWALARPEIVVVVAGTIVGIALTTAGLSRLLPSALRTVRTVVGAAAALKLLLAAGFFGVHYFLPVALTDVQGLSATVAGLILTVGSATWTVGAFISTRGLDRVGPRSVALVGCAALMTGTAAMFLILDADVTPVVAFPLWAVAAIGMGLAFNTSNSTAMDAAVADGQDAGDLATALSMGDVLGGAIASGVGGAILATGAREGWSDASALAGVFGVMIGVLAVAAVVAVRLPRRRPTAAPAPAEAPAV